MKSKHLTVGWKVASLNPSVASLRYRALFPILSLKEKNVESHIFSRADYKNLTGLDVLVIVKSFQYEDYLLAKHAVDRQIPVVFDLCDNIFISDIQEKNSYKPSEVFMDIAKLASLIVVTTDELASVVKGNVGDLVSVTVIPDVIETPKLALEAKRLLVKPKVFEYPKRIAGRFVKEQIKRFKHCYQMLRSISSSNFVRNYFKSYASLGPRKFIEKKIYNQIKIAYKVFDCSRRAIRTALVTKCGFGKTHVDSNDAKVNIKFDIRTIKSIRNDDRKIKRILWFGNHGASYGSFGLTDIKIIQDALEKIALEVSFELWVISNNVEKYKTVVAPMAFNSVYFEWSPEITKEALQKVDVVVVPNSLDEFSICKSANRSLLALHQEIPVVATKTKALEVLSPHIRFDDFENHLRFYLNNPIEAKFEARAAAKKARDIFSLDMVGDKWIEALKNDLKSKKATFGQDDAEIAFVIHLPQDVDMLKPLIEQVKGLKTPYVVLTSILAIRKWKGLKETIANMTKNYKVLPDGFNGFDFRAIFSESIYALVSATETNLPPHKFSNQLAKIANKLNISTFTMQHGLENVGLTYSDQYQSIEKIEFSSRNIFIWGDLTTLHKRVKQETKVKCIPVGISKSRATASPLLEGFPIDQTRPLIGIFENLHWKRYSGEYREFFLDTVIELCRKFTETNFLIKPHPAGKWLTTRFKGNIPEADNLIIIDPEQSQWRDASASMLMEYFAGIITTPSTIALDAAMVGTPVGVIAHDLNLDNYQPLNLICTLDDAITYTETLVSEANSKNRWKKALEQFVTNSVVDGDATTKMLKIIHSKKINKEN